MADDSAHAIRNQVLNGAVRGCRSRAIGRGDRSVERFSGSAFFGEAVAPDRRYSDKSLIQRGKIASYGVSGWIVGHPNIRTVAEPDGA